MPRRPTRAIRLFVAAFPQLKVRESMRSLISDDLANRHRPTPIEQIHLTVLFLGDRPERDLESIIESVRRSASGIPAFTLTPTRLISLPQRHAPRLVALETDAPPPLMELHHRLVSRLANAPRKADRFLPHFTICRFAGGSVPSRTDRTVSLAPFVIDSIDLMRSVLGRDGAHHSVIERIALRPEPRHRNPNQ